MSSTLSVILMFVFLIVGLLTGLPLAFVLGAIGILFGLFLLGPACLPMFISRIWSVMDNWELIAVPLFILMGNFLSQSGIAEGLFNSLRYLFGPFRGGVAMAVVVVSTVFAACTGVIAASVVTMGLLAGPVLLKYGYSKEITAGGIMAGGTLGILIPPSIMLVLMGPYAGLSVGKLFMGGVMPGLLLSGLYLIYIAIRCWRDPKQGPALSPEERAAVPIRKRLSGALVNLVPAVILVVGVLGSIFLGIATPTEAAGVGAFVAFLMILGYRRFSWQMTKDTIASTAKTTAMVLMIVIGASLFTGTFLRLGGGDVVSNFIMTVGVTKWGIFALMMFIIFILGMFIDWIGILMICIPLFVPIAVQLGFDKLYFCLLMAVNLQASFLTPPFGYAIFYIRPTLPEYVTLLDIYRSIIPFVILIIIGLVLCIIFPPIAIWLPSVMIK